MAARRDPDSSAAPFVAPDGQAVDSPEPDTHEADWPQNGDAPRARGPRGWRLPVADAELARAEGASDFMVRAAGTIEKRWPAVGGSVAFGIAFYGRYWRHRGAVLAGGLAFFGMLSLVPSLLTLGALLTRVVDPEWLMADLRARIAENPEAAEVLDPVLDQIMTIAEANAASVSIAGIVGLFFSLYAASRFVYVSRQVLDIAFEVEPRPPSVVTRAISVAITLVFQVMILVGLAVLSVLPRLIDRLGLPAIQALDSVLLRVVLPLVVVYLLLSVSMRYGTSLRSVPWLNLGAALGSLAIVLGTFGLGWYLSVSVTYSQVIAILGGVIALELWLYLVGQAIVLSAEIEALRIGRWHVPRIPLGLDVPGPSD